MDTILTKKYPVSKIKFTDIVAEKVAPMQQQFIRAISDLLTEIKSLCSEKRSILMMGRNVYLDTKLKILLPNFELFDEDNVTDLLNENFEEYFEDKYFDEGLQYELPTLTQLRAKRKVLMEMYEEGNKFVCKCNDKRYSSYLELEVAYDPYSDDISMKLEKPATIIPILNLDYTYVNELLVDYLVPYGMCPNDLSIEMVQCLSDLVTIYKRYPGSLYITAENKVAFCGGKYLVEEYGTDSDKTWMNSIHWNLVSVLKQIYDRRVVGEVEMDTREDLLNCEKVRADIDPYEERLLTDPNRGHWDLWLGQDESQYTVEVADEMVARNPICDINENGVIAIDFGTKSTIVVYQSDIEHSLPMGIGDGNLTKEPTPKRYENPTVMHFVDLESFLKDYASRKGRPKTKWENLTISHTAMDQFANSKSEEYYEYLHKIKQWAGQRE